MPEPAVTCHFCEESPATETSSTGRPVCRPCALVVAGVLEYFGVGQSAGGEGRAN